MDYAVFGKGKTPLVILPGLTLRDVKGAGAGLAWMYRRFAQDYRVYVLDKNTDIPKGCTIADLAEDAATAMQALHITDACLFGVSLGGMIAQELAISYPHLVRKLVLGVTASRTNDTLRAVVDRWIAQAENGNFGGMVREMLTLMYSDAYAKRYRCLFPVLAKVSKPKDAQRFVRLAQACLTCQTYERLMQIQAPTLVLGGAADRIVGAEASPEIAERLSCEIHMYEGLGHAAYEEAADFNLRIQRFLL